MKRKIKFVLPLPRKPDPVLTEDELDAIATVVDEWLSRTEAILRRQKVSESVLRLQIELQDARAKIEQVLGR